MENTIITALLFLPFIFILWLANLADRRRNEEDRHDILAVLTYGLLGSLYVAMILFGLLAAWLGTSAANLAPGAPTGLELMGIDPSSAQPALAGMGRALWLPALLAIVLLLPPVRALLAHLLPIDRTRTVHAVALSYSMLIVSNLMLTLGWGLSSMAAAMESAQNGSAGSLVLATWAQELLWLLVAVVGVGWLSRRALGPVLRRLGIVRPSLRQLGVGLGVGLALVPAALLLEALAGRLGMGADPEVGRLTEALLGPLFHSLPGVLTLGLAAALGEESLFRGAMQPRFGLLPTAALFTLLHSNYGLTLSTLIVLLLGLVLGLLRRHANSTTSMAAHATYNISLGLLAFLQIV
jgi:hypothetical protein